MEAGEGLEQIFRVKGVHIHSISITCNGEGRNILVASEVGGYEQDRNETVSTTTKTGLLLLCGFLLLFLLGSKKNKVKKGGTDIEISAYLGSAGFAHTLVSLVGAGNAESPESLEFFFGSSNFSWGFGRLNHREGDGYTTGSGGLEVFRLSWTLRMETSKKNPTNTHG